MKQVSNASPEPAVRGDGNPYPVLAPVTEPSEWTVLDLFSAAAGGWSLGMHRAGFKTVAACEVEEWRRILYSENNPDVAMFEDVRTVTASGLVGRLGFLPRIVVGSSPCQDISSANTKGKGVDGERSGLVFDAVRLVGEIRPRWVALENSANLRTKGADRVLAALAALGYACEPCVVGADNVGADHERKRSWLIAFDPEQVTDAASLGHESGRAWGRRSDGHDAPPTPSRHDGDTAKDGRAARRPRRRPDPNEGLYNRPYLAIRDGDGDGDAAACAQSLWNGGLAHHLRVDDGLSAWVAQSSIAVGGPRGTAGSGLLVEAFGDSVLPQIPEAIGRAILRTEAALAAIYGSREAA